MFLKVNIQNFGGVKKSNTHTYLYFIQHVVSDYRLLEFSFIAANEACLTRLINPLTFKTLVPDSQFCNLVMLAPPGRRLSRFLDEIFSFLRRFEQLVAALTSLLPRLTKLWLK